MSTRHLPVRPDLTQLKRQAKDLLSALHTGDSAAIDDLRTFHPEALAPETARLADAQLTLARSYGVPSWPRLVVACELIDAIWRGDKETVRALIDKHPNLLQENARGTAQCNWGKALSYAANVGQDAIVTLLLERGADDLQYAFERACLRGKLDTARLLYGRGARPQPGSVMGPCETLSAQGLALQLELGATITDADGDRLAPLGLLLETYSRNPQGKHACLEIFAQQGYAFPDTPALAVHRGRLDLLTPHVQRDPSLLDRPVTHTEMFPPILGCHTDPAYALCGTPISGGTLLHLAVEDDAEEVVRWLLENGADPNARALIDSDGFGGHTALFHTVVSQAYACGHPTERIAKLLLDHGADPNARATLRKRLIDSGDDALYEYPDVTPHTWGERFHNRQFVNPAVLTILENFS